MEKSSTSIDKRDIKNKDRANGETLVTIDSNKAVEEDEWRQDVKEGDKPGLVAKKSVAKNLSRVDVENKNKKKWHQTRHNSKRRSSKRHIISERREKRLKRRRIRYQTSHNTTSRRLNSRSPSSKRFKENKRKR